MSQVTIRLTANTKSGSDRQLLTRTTLRNPESFLVALVEAV